MTDKTPSHTKRTHKTRLGINWYEKMHHVNSDASSTSQNTHVVTSIRRVNLSIFFRMWVAVAIIIVISGVVVFKELYEQVEPMSKQVVEDSLVDTSKVLAIYFAQPLATGDFKNTLYQQKLDTAFNTPFYNQQLQHIHELNTRQLFIDGMPKLNQFNKTHRETNSSLSKNWFNTKTRSSFRVYITDVRGLVIYDSRQENNAEGHDYSKWNDVYLTLNGQYGARSSRDIEEDASTSIMYVAQPIHDIQGKLIGVVSVGKPVVTILPYLHVTKQKMLYISLFIMLVAIVFSGIIAWWLKQSIKLVIAYTQSLASNTQKPNFYFGRELNVLTDNIEQMKDSIENKAYVSDYVHTLTHELKSPLTAIKASGELLGDADLDNEDRQLLSQTINEQSQKLQVLIDKLLLLAKVEQPNFKLDSKPINVSRLLQTLLLNQQASLQRSYIQLHCFYQNQQKDISDIVPLTEKIPIFADEFWLSQALDNVLSNAIYFADSYVKVYIRVEKNPTRKLIISFINDGTPIPAFALTKVFDKYFSLSHHSGYQRQHTDQNSFTNNKTSKGTGLGLTLAQQVIEHHHGSISINNITDTINLANIATENIQTTQQSHNTQSSQELSEVLVNVELPVM